MNDSLTNQGCRASIEVRTHRELLAAVRRRDRHALARLSQMYYPRLACMLRGLLLPDAAIEDVIIETFSTVWTSTEDLDDEPKGSTWIVGIACRLAMQALPITQTRVIDRNDRLSAALLCLPLEQRVTLTLAYHMRFSLDEICQATDCPAAIVENWMTLARTSLRTHALWNSP